MIRFLVPTLVLLIPSIVLADDPPKTYAAKEFIEMWHEEQAKIELKVKEANGVFSKEAKIREEETRKFNKKWTGRKFRISGEVAGVDGGPGFAGLLTEKEKAVDRSITFHCIIKDHSSDLNCHFSRKKNPRDVKKLDDLVRGQEVVVEGVFRPSGGYGLHDCIFITPQDKAK
jgi:hypothetical protein